MYLYAKTIGGNCIYFRTNTISIFKFTYRNVYALPLTLKYKPLQEKLFKPIWKFLKSLKPYDFMYPDRIIQT